MTIFRTPRAVLRAGMMGAIAGIVLAGGERGPEATAAPPPANTATGQAPETADSRNSSVVAASAIRVTVSLSPALTGKAAPDDVVFIFARAASGSRMPLAIVRKLVRDLPVTVVLDDSQAMNSHMKLSGVSELAVVARISKSGQAYPQDGDLEGVSAPVAHGAGTVAISIDTVLAGQKGPHGYR